MLAWYLGRSVGDPSAEDAVFERIGDGVTVGSNHVVYLGGLGRASLEHLIEVASALPLTGTDYVLINTMALSPIAEYRLIPRDITPEDHAVELRRAELLTISMQELVNTAAARGVQTGADGVDAVGLVELILEAEGLGGTAPDEPAAPAPEDDDPEDDATAEEE